MREHPARNTRSAYTRRRRTWYGHGRFVTVEKDALGCWIHDTTTTFADISVLSLPILYVFLLSKDMRFFGVKSTAFVAWMTMTLFATAIRGGWLKPFGTDVHGWVSATPSLVLFRLLYYNPALALAAYAGAAVFSAIRSPLFSTGVSFLVGAVAAMAFPRLAERYFALISE